MLRVASAYKHGVHWMKQGQYQEAIKYFQQSIRENKEIAKSYQGCARAYFHLRRYAEAEDACSEVLQLPDKLIEDIKDEIYFRLGCIYLNQEKFEEALKSITLAIQFNDNDIKFKDKQKKLFIYYAYRGRANSASQYVEAAIIDFETSVKLHPVAAHFKLLSAEYAKNNDQFNAFRCLINALSADMIAKQQLTEKLVAEYNSLLAPFNATDILDVIRSMPVTDAIKILNASEINNNLFKKYYPAESVNLGLYDALSDRYVFIAEKCGMSESLNIEIIKIFLKVMLVEMRSGKNTSELIDKVGVYFTAIDSEQILDVMDAYFMPEDTMFLLQQYENKLIRISEQAPSEYSENVAQAIMALKHEINFRKYINQSDSVRLTTQGLNILFAPKIEKTATSLSLASNDGSVSKNKVI